MSPSDHDPEQSGWIAPRVTRRAMLAGAALAAVGVARRDPGAGAVPSGALTPTPAASPTAVDQAAALSALAAAGIGVYEGALDSAPLVAVAAPGPVALLGYQFRAMLAEANLGGGVLGADLDELTLDPAFSPWDSAVAATPEPGAAPIPPSALAAAYVTTADSPGATLARAFLPAVDLARASEIAFPNLVLCLFAAEVAREEGGAGLGAWTPGGASGPRALLPQAGACSAVQGFIDQVLHAIFSALHVNLGSSIPGKILGGIINGLLGIAETAVSQALKTLTAPVLAIVKTIAGVVGAVSIVVSAIRPWTVLVTPNPAATRLSVGSEAPLAGRVDCVVDLGGFDRWPAGVADCAAAAGVPLPDLKPAGAPCRWQVVNLTRPLIASDAPPTALDGDSHAVLTYHTLSEDAETAKGDPVQGKVKVTVAIQRPAVADLQRVLANAIFAQLPALVATVIRPMLGPSVDSLIAKIAALAESRASAILSVTYHTQKVKTPTPEPTKPSGKPGTIDVTFTSAQPVAVPVTIALKAESCDEVNWTGSITVDLHVHTDVEQFDLHDTSPCAWSFAKGKTAKTKVGPFTSESVSKISGTQPYTLVLRMTAVKSKGKQGSLGAIAFTFSASVALGSTTVDSPVTGAANLGKPIAIEPGASGC